MTYNIRVILRTISVVLLFEGTAMLIAVGSAVYFGEQGAANGLFFTSLICILIGLGVYKNLSYYTLRIKSRESYFVAFICWFTVCFMGTLPYLLSGSGISFADCVFESVSGWTTTGAWSIDINTLPRSLVLWKAITNWLGGMGLLLLTISIFPILGAEGQKMAAAEAPGPEFEKMAARSGETGKISYRIYIAMTIAEFLLLLPSGLPVFDAAINTMSTISTAGLLNLNDAVTSNFTPYVKTIFTVFSIAGSINFLTYLYLYQRKLKKAFGIEVRTYLALLSGGAVIIACVLCFSGHYETITGALGDAFAQTVAFGSTSGYEIVDINLWPTTAKLILLVLLLIGGCANSTSGSIKVIRFMIYFKLIFRGIYKRIHPRAVKPVMIQGKPVSAATASSVTVFIILYFALLVFSSLVFSLENMDMETTFSTALACMSNNGTGFGTIAGGNFSNFSGLGKIYASVLMLAGRLELYAIILLFSRSFWNSDRARS